MKNMKKNDRKQEQETKKVCPDGTYWEYVNAIKCMECPMLFCDKNPRKKVTD